MILEIGFRFCVSVYEVYSLPLVEMFSPGCYLPVEDKMTNFKICPEVISSCLHKHMSTWNWLFICISHGEPWSFTALFYLMIFFVAKHYLKCHLTGTPDISPDLDSVPLIYWISVIALLQSFMRNMWSNDLAVTIIPLVLCWEGSFMNETL